MKKSNYWLLAVFSFSLMFIAGCTGGQLDPSKLTKEDVNKIIECDKPYIRYAAGCCLDQNNNKICDDDEKTETRDLQAETGTLERLPNYCTLKPGFVCKEFQVSPNNIILVIDHDRDYLSVREFNVGDCSEVTANLKMGVSQLFEFRGCNNGLEGSIFDRDITLNLSNKDKLDTIEGHLKAQVENPARFLPNSCTLFPGLACTEFKVSDGTDKVQIYVRNGIGDSLVVTGLTANAGTCTGTEPVLPYTIDDGAETSLSLTGCTTTGASGSRFRTDITVTYTLGTTRLSHTRTGALVAQVEP